MSIETLLSRVKHRETGRGRYIAQCPAHDDKHPSLTLRETDDGRILLHCFAGCSAEEVLSAVSLEFDALYPPRETFAKSERQRVNPADALRAIALEATVVWIAAADISNGLPVSEETRTRFGLAHSRIQSALGESNLG